MRLSIKQTIAAIKLASRAFRSYRGYIALLALLSFLSGLLEGIGVNAVIPLLAIVTGAASGGSDAISKAIESLFVLVNVDFSIKFILIFIIILFVLKTAAVLFINYIKVRISASYEQEMRTSLFQNMLGSNWQYLLDQKLGHLETILMTNIRFASEFLGQISEVIIVGIGLVIYTTIALNIDVRITLLTLAIGFFLLLVLRPLLTRTRTAAVATAAANREAAHYINESVSGMKTIKAFGTSQIIANRGDRLFKHFRDLRIRTMLLKSIGSSLFQPISVVFVSVIFAVSYKLPGFEFASLVAVVYLIQRIFSYIQQLQGNLHNMTESIPYLEHVLAYEEETMRFQDIPSGRERFRLIENIAFDKVAFTYDNKTPVLSNLTLSIPKGSFCGIVGPSGSGKTTLVDLLLRLFQPTSGSITIDGVPINEIAIKDWHAKVGYVSQDLFLTNDTVANNILFYDDSFSDAELKEAAKKAHCLDFVEKLPLGFNTPVGERGVRLSVGQRQRIVLARVLIRKPEFLVLDEATSALDNESEAQVQKVIEALKGEMTVLAIAHRTSTIVNADHIFVMGDGTVIEEGEPQKLLANPGSAFHKLVNVGS